MFDETPGWLEPRAFDLPKAATHPDPHHLRFRRSFRLLPGLRLNVDWGGPRVPSVQAVRDTGYLDQLDRARRFLVRMKTSGTDFQDMAWSFFQHCWHVKDWVHNDLALPKTPRNAVKKMVERQSAALTICQDLCNGTKHLKLRDPRSGSGAMERNIGYTMYTDDRPNEIDCVIEDGRGGFISGRTLADQCIAEWERILRSKSLDTARSSSWEL